MKIECILKRPGGTRVTIGGKAYHFAPDASGRHVAEVADEAHIARFLSLSEGYRAVLAEKAADTKTGAAGEGDEGDQDDDLEAAKAEYVEKFGKKPHHTWSAEVIRQKIAEA